MLSTFSYLALSLLACADARTFTFSNTTVSFNNGSLYQAALGENNKYVYLTSSVGRPPVTQTNIFKVDATTLERVQDYLPPIVNVTTGARLAAYGVGTDNVRSTVWITNTRQNTASVYSQSDLSLLHEYDINAVSHSRDVVVDEASGKAYISSATDTYVDVFDAVTYEELGPIYLNETEAFEGVMSMDLDPATGKLYTVSLDEPLGVVIDTRNGNALNYFHVPEGNSTSGIAFDPSRGHVYVVGQDAESVAVIDTADGSIIGSIPVPIGGLNAAYDAKNDLVYVANRPEAAVYVIDATINEVIAVLSTGANTNDVVVSSDGIAYAVDKGTPTTLWRIVPTLEEDTTTTTTSTSPNSTSTSTSSHASGASNSTAGTGTEGPGGASTKTGGASGHASGEASGEASGSAGAGGHATTQTVVNTVFTTYCPSPTTFTWGSSEITVTAATTLTLTDCPVCHKTTGAGEKPSGSAGGKPSGGAEKPSSGAAGSAKPSGGAEKPSSGAAGSAKPSSGASKSSGGVAEVTTPNPTAPVQANGATKPLVQGALGVAALALLM